VPGLRSALAEVLRPITGLAGLQELTRLTGGASRETWLVQLDDGTRLILRLDRVSSAMSSSLADEVATLKAAAAAGVPVPAVVTAGEYELGAPFVICEYIAGETLPGRILRDSAFANARPLLAQQCGLILAQIHRIPPAALSHLALADPLASLWARLDDFVEPSAIFELTLRRLEATRPPSARPVVVHGDFRTGNLMIGPDGIRAVLDWELCHLGDPVEDLAHLCTRAWRFGGPGRVGGFGSLSELNAGYEQAGGSLVDPERFRWWELRAALWWGITCLEMAKPHLEGKLRSVERAAIGRRAREQEYDLACLLRKPMAG
jgi:aminoglycoside phosphotransferase (APT) family kinase protein